MIRRLLSLLAGSLLCIGLAAAQDTPSGKSKSGGTETSLTGCLTKAADGSYLLADEKTGKQVMVTGPSDLEKHSANHKVRLTGTETKTGGTMTFEATKIQHISPTCPPASK